ncbi:hypothetical protein LTR64_004756 [Lithohypha guttulata]|uniref:uncharacterized protein n=1 Tax=Lithohypha guttulata TaxID=1690604 RepID=UPI00315DDFE9
MQPASPLPIDPHWLSTEEYVESLLTFVSTSELFRNLCGGVHILDFLTREPDLYSWVLPQDWREWFEDVDVEDVLDLLLREDLDQFAARGSSLVESRWRNHKFPPASLIDYARDVRKHSLKRELQSRRAESKLGTEALPRHIAVGMKPKKIHEVMQFAAFVEDLSQYIQDRSTHVNDNSKGEVLGNEKANRIATGTQLNSEITVVDFGSGQNYLGRTLACPPYNRKVIAIEQRHHNVEGAKGMDVSARLAKKEKKMINKKEWKAQWQASRGRELAHSPKVVEIVTGSGLSEQELQDIESRIPQLPLYDLYERPVEAIPQSRQDPLSNGNVELSTDMQQKPSKHDPHFQEVQDESIGTGAIEYVEKELSSGDLQDILAPTCPPLLVVSIHSCGNLTHHGLRSVTLNPSVQAVALIGCCYNLLTERLGPPTHKLLTLRSNHPRLEATSSAFDTHGFPMSRRLEEFEYPINTTMSRSNECQQAKSLDREGQNIGTTSHGVRFNITARMMAVQAPHNWGPMDSEEFFTRHYYRALLQRILLDLGVVKMAHVSCQDDIEVAGGTLSGKDNNGTPLIIGSLRKSCFSSFIAYVKGAVQKLVADPVHGPEIQRKTGCLFEYNDNLIHQYEKDFKYAKKQLSVIWSLMAFSANVVESTILVDRWLWLKEQDQIQDAWVEAVFDYKQSPRNMVVVGLKK